MWRMATLGFRPTNSGTALSAAYVSSFTWMDWMIFFNPTVNAFVKDAPKVDVMTIDPRIEAEQRAGVAAVHGEGLVELGHGLFQHRA